MSTPIALEAPLSELSRRRFPRSARRAMVAAIERSERLVGRADFMQWLDYVLAGGLLPATALLPATDPPTLVLPAYASRDGGPSVPCLVVLLETDSVLLAWSEGSALDPTGCAAVICAENIRRVTRENTDNPDDEEVALTTGTETWTIEFYGLGTPGFGSRAVDAFVTATLRAAATHTS